MKDRLFDSNDIPPVVQGISLDNVEALSHAGIYSTVWKARVYEATARALLTLSKQTFKTRAYRVESA